MRGRKSQNLKGTRGCVGEDTAVLRVSRPSCGHLRCGWVCPRKQSAWVSLAYAHSEDNDGRVESEKQQGQRAEVLR